MRRVAFAVVAAATGFFMGSIELWSFVVLLGVIVETGESSDASTG